MTIQQTILSSGINALAVGLSSPATWNKITKIVHDIESTELSGAAKKQIVLDQAKELFSTFALWCLNLIIELAVAQLRIKAGQI